jgi:hypothetical protein
MGLINITRTREFRPSAMIAIPRLQAKQVTAKVSTAKMRVPSPIKGEEKFSDMIATLMPLLIFT